MMKKTMERYPDGKIIKSHNHDHFFILCSILYEAIDSNAGIRYRIVLTHVPAPDKHRLNEEDMLKLIKKNIKKIEKRITKQTNTL